MSNDNTATSHNLDTSEGARTYVAEFFANQLRRHDFRGYILTELAADFACALAQHLSAQPSPGGQGDALFTEELAELRRLVPSVNQKQALDAAVAALAARQPVAEGYEVWAQNAENVAAELTDERAIKALRFAARGIRCAARQPVGDHLAQDRKMVSQPVGEPVAFMVRWKAEGGFGLEWPKNMQYFRDRADEYEIVPLHREAPSGQAVDLGPSIPSELAPVAAALKRFNECAEDCESDGCDIGRDWFDALTTMGLLKRTQRSPAVWTMTAEGERLLALIDSKAVGNG